MGQGRAAGPMRSTAVVPVLALFLALTSGCVGGVTETPSGGDDRDLVAPDSAVAAHEAAKREDSSITVAPRPAPNPGYIARQTVTVRNSLEGFQGAVATYSSPGGPVTVRAGTEDGYVAVAQISATGLTESEARSALATIHIDVTDTVEGNVLQLGMAGRLDTLTNPVAVTSNRQVALEIALPASLAYDLTATTQGGGLDVRGLGGPALEADSSGGGLSLEDLSFRTVDVESAGGGISARDITGDEVKIRSAGGGLDADIEARQADVQSSGGGMSVEFRPTATGSSKFSSGGGGLAIQLARDDAIAYDVHAQSGGGGCSVSIHDAETTGSATDKRAKSRNFATARIQATIDAQSGGGGLTVED